MFNEAIAARAVGGYPISVATSLALESACGVHPEIPVKSAPLLEYTELWINLRTLFRNFLGALDKDTVKGVGPANIADNLLVEMETIHGIVAEVTHGRARPVYYLSNYARLEQQYRHAVLRVDNTVRQKEYTAIQTKSLERLLAALKGQPDVHVYDLKLHPPHPTKSMLLTHYAYDLLAASHFHTLVLLESHTGAIKPRPQWYTKYYQGRELSQIPFTEYFLQIFGDNETFRPMDLDLRRSLLEIAQKYNWSAVSTRDKIRYGVEQMKNPYFRTVVTEMMSGK